MDNKQDKSQLTTKPRPQPQTADNKSGQDPQPVPKEAPLNEKAEAEQERKEALSERD